MDVKDDKMTLIEKCKMEGTLPGFAISKMPIPLFEAFMSDVYENYNGVYWTKLQDLMRKAEVYDNVIRGQEQPQKEPQQEVKEETKTIKTFTSNESVK